MLAQAERLSVAARAAGALTETTAAAARQIGYTAAVLRSYGLNMAGFGVVGEVNSGTATYAAGAPWWAALPLGSSAYAGINVYNSCFGG